MKFRKAGLVVVLILVAVLFLLNRKDILLNGQTISLKPIGSTGYELNSEIKLYNGNFLSSTISKIFEEVYVNGVKVGELDNEINQGIPSGKETVFPVSIRFSKADIRNFKNDTSSSRKVEVMVKGEILFQNVLGGGKILVNQKDSVYAIGL